MSFDITASVYCDHDRDLNIDDGTTCAALRNLLYSAGLDVHASVIRVFRKGKIHIGRMDGFLLQPGDHVEFRTSYDLVVEHDVAPKKVVHKVPEYDQAPVGCPTREQLHSAINAIFDSLHIC